MFLSIFGMTKLGRGNSVFLRDALPSQDEAALPVPLWSLCAGKQGLCLSITEELLQHSWIITR